MHRGRTVRKVPPLSYSDPGSPSRRTPRHSLFPLSLPGLPFRLYPFPYPARLRLFLRFLHPCPVIRQHQRQQEPPRKVRLRLAGRVGFFSWSGPVINKTAGAVKRRAGQKLHGLSGRVAEFQIEGVKLKVGRHGGVLPVLIPGIAQDRM